MRFVMQIVVWIVRDPFAAFVIPNFGDEMAVRAVDVFCDRDAAGDMSKRCRETGENHRVMRAHRDGVFFSMAPIQATLLPCKDSPWVPRCIGVAKALVCPGASDEGA